MENDYKLKLDRLLKGRFNDLEPHRSKIVRIFLSSTFSGIYIAI